ncbi:PREDICTED: F-box protein At4g35930 [Nelumbo nucifera]|uniref:F-box protein At4g35930 n=2 Tax=Nelumbo nucifera TaxID=4432 RepID=A0A1U8ASF3_NELNU|nr:PREDICTED: F-box protein At4g35930 [Nelumbo nucifera]XP_010266006.1 PREDICTED: F-box protein At4g35930 [Nelumbo nucifera]XP_010266007.1 PREDICTED: F-box protein At4g35930 [Nelumbo nucifera]DAD41677.1 TPA_asm: hypothetical protein HUJ06_016000 [Nelumbo nucifera]
MGKVSPKDENSMTPKQKRRLRKSSNKYVKRGSRSQLRYSRATSAKSCTDLGKKRVVVLDSNETKSESVLNNKFVLQSPPILSPERITFRPAGGALDSIRQNSLPKTPKTPQDKHWESESRLESLPMDLLVKILCHLHHDELEAVFYVSQKLRKAVDLAMNCHFNYTTPDRSRQEMLNMKTPLPTERWPFMSKRDGKQICPHTPKAPRHGARPPSRLNITEMRKFSAVLFPESAFPSRCVVLPGLPKPPCKSLASNRALFCEDDLCQAVAQNKLR